MSGRGGRESGRTTTRGGGNRRKSDRARERRGRRGARRGERAPEHSRGVEWGAQSAWSGEQGRARRGEAGRGGGRGERRRERGGEERRVVERVVEVRRSACRISSPPLRPVICNRVRGIRSLHKTKNRVREGRTKGKIKNSHNNIPFILLTTLEEYVVCAKKKKKKNKKKQQSEIEMRHAPHTHKHIYLAVHHSSGQFMPVSGTPFSHSHCFTVHKRNTSTCSTKFKQCTFTPMFK